MWETSSTVNSFHRVKRSVSNSTKRSCCVCFAHYARKDESCGRTIRGCFTTTCTQHPELFLAEKNIVTLEQLPYSPDVDPWDFFLFPKCKGIIKWIRFEGVVTMKMFVVTELMGIQEEYIYQWIEAWERVSIRFELHWKGEKMVSVV